MNDMAEKILALVTARGNVSFAELNREIEGFAGDKFELRAEGPKHSNIVSPNATIRTQAHSGTFSPAHTCVEEAAPTTPSQKMSLVTWSAKESSSATKAVGGANHPHVLAVGLEQKTPLRDPPKNSTAQDL